ncbi:MAG: Flp pilus assembly complex ATPase component TadA [Candidatus Sericytochromatia bacterium]|nr:Flp pilus assembly complex ATPase component TadA [Candidatus Sericytochromatia bacterium]
MLQARVLVVDDCPETLFLLQSLLRTAGHDVHGVGHGQAALHWLQQHPQTDLILLDIDLPDMSGYEICESLQDEPELAMIPVIMVTANMNAETRLRAFQVGAVGFVQKPVVADYLMEQVGKALAVHDKWQHPAPAVAEAQPEPVSVAQTVGQAPAATQPAQDTSPAHPQALTLADSRALNSSVGSAAEAGALVPYQAQGFEVLQEQPDARAIQLPVLQRAARLSFADFVRQLFAGIDAAKERGFRPELIYEQAFQMGISAQQVIAALAQYTGWPVLDQLLPEHLRLGVLPTAFCRRHQVIPFQQGEQVAFALTHPFNLEVDDALRSQGEAPRFLLLPEQMQTLLLGERRAPEAERANLADVMGAVQARYGSADDKSELLGLSPEELAELEKLEDEASAPMIRLANRIIEAAYHQGASDIHIEAREEGVLIRYRIDGVLQDQHLLQPAEIIHPLVARLKIMAGLNIAEKRLPQDGRIVYKDFTRRQIDFDLRVAIAPMHFGEKVVMRIIDKQKSTLPLSDLGFSEYNLRRYRELIQSPYGMVLHVGPTGSGKSMTLYAALNEINRPEINIQTIEDPIEYTLPRLNQLQVQSEIGLSFARALRAYLRQDPDVILVGEIRDPETAHIAAEAALTGHLLLSTLHTNDAASTLTRLVEMGVSPFMLSPSVVMICAQRLMRRLCQLCAVPYKASAQECRLLGEHDSAALTLYRPAGCELCHQTGFKGRVGIHELLIPSEDLRATLTQPGVSSEQLKRMAVADGMITLFWDAMAKVKTGMTSLEEALRHVKADEFDTRPRFSV